MEKNYDFWLVIASLGIAVLTSFLSVVFAKLIYWHKSDAKSFWHWIAAINLGLGIWGMHYTGMMALHLDVPFAFAYGKTLLSAMIAIVAAYLTFNLLLTHDSQKNPPIFLGAFILGTGVLLMHYLGMDAMQMFPPIQYNAYLVGLSMLIAYGAAWFALRVFNQKITVEFPDFFTQQNILYAFFMAFGIAGMHYTGMAAARFDRSSYCTVLENGLSPGLVSLLIVFLVGTILFISFLLMLFEQKKLIRFAHEQLRKQAIDEEVYRSVTHLVAEKTLALEQQKSLTESIVQNLHAVVMMLDVHGNIELFNEHAEKLMGYRTDELVGTNIFESLLPKEDKRSAKQFFAWMIENKMPSKIRHSVHAKDGTKLTVDWSNSVLLNDAGEVSHILAMGVDATKGLEAERQLQLSEVAFNTQEALVITDEHGKILRINKAFEEVTGYQSSEVLGQQMSIVKSGKQDKTFYKEMWRAIFNEGFWAGEIWNRRKNGEIYPEWLRITKIVDESAKIVNFVGNFADISEKKRYERKLEKYAFYDPVTDLPNRRLFEDRFNQVGLLSRESHQYMALFFIDLDDFKKINDSKGHAFGDEFLRQFSLIVKQVIADKMTLARFGGDEFLILMPELTEDIGAAISIAENLALDLMEAFKAGCVVSNEFVEVSASIGISVTDCQNITCEEVFIQADTAMYLAKSEGKNNFQFFSANFQKEMTERIELEKALKRSLHDNQDFYMVYQPQYNRALQPIGAEALLRWHSPGLGLVSPAVFIPIAESMGLIDRLGTMVIQKVIDDIVRYGDGLLPSGFEQISINLSIKQLHQKDLAQQIKAQFEKAGISPKNIRLEFTESALLDKRLDTKQLLEELSNIGFSFSLDDFGTGFSSMAYLKELPISEIKIDKSFVDGLPAEENDQIICEATLFLANKLGLESVAEGIETPEQLQWLLDSGCQVFQGFYLSKPVKYPEMLEKVVFTA